MNFSLTGLLIITAVGLLSGCVAAFLVRRNAKRLNLAGCLIWGVAGAFFSVCLFYFLRRNAPTLVQVLEAVPGAILLLWCVIFVRQKLMR